jgi:hypothetical protein
VLVPATAGSGVSRASAVPVSAGLSGRSFSHHHAAAAAAAAAAAGYVVRLTQGAVV